MKTVLDKPGMCYFLDMILKGKVFNFWIKVCDI